MFDAELHTYTKSISLPGSNTEVGIVLDVDLAADAPELDPDEILHLWIESFTVLGAGTWEWSLKEFAYGGIVWHAGESGQYGTYPAKTPGVYFRSANPADLRVLVVLQYTVVRREPEVGSANVVGFLEVETGEAITDETGDPILVP